MIQKTVKIYSLQKLWTILSMLAVTGLLALSSCEKEKTSDFNADFSFEYIDDNHVNFINQSTGEYYWLVWDFDNGEIDSLTDKNATVEVYFSAAGTYNVKLEILNYYGSRKSVTKTVEIANDDIMVDFTATIDADNPNYVQLKNTSLGLWDSFKWKYLNKEVLNQMEYVAYFPFAGDYDIELVVTQNSAEFSKIQSVTITQDDPDYDPTLIWSEEFNYTGMPDPSKWNMETGGSGWGNNELQYYTNSENNAYVANGLLTITALEEPQGGRDYTSARITTQGKFDVKYGRIEARIKLPYGKGLWPAFWMLGANLNTVGWPACGEIDIMEMVGGDTEPNSDNTCHATIHWDNNGDKASYGLPYTLPSGIFADDFHVFGITWDSQEIRGYMDDEEYFVADITPAALSEFQNNFFIILNVAVGGDWPGSPDENTVFPQTMQVDWVRVYSE